MTTRKTFATISASSVETFEACPRQWWYQYVLGHRQPSTPAMKHGTAVHADIEDYLTGKTEHLRTPEAKEALASGHIPEPRVVQERGAVELDLRGCGLTLPIPGAKPLLRVLGKIDLLMPTVPPFGDGKHPDAVIRDWKIRGRLDYAPEGADLHRNTQARFYAMAFFMLSPEAQAVLFEHGNMLRMDGGKGRKTPRSSRHGTLLTRQEVEEWRDGQLASTIARMWETSKAPRPHLTRKELGSCFRHGRCYYQQTPLPELMGATCEDTPCSLPDSAPAGAPTREDNVNILDIIAKKKAASATSSTPAPQGAAAQESAPPAQPAPQPSASAAPPATTLDLAKGDYADDPDGFDLEGYGLTPAEIREFVRWKTQRDGKEATPPPSAPSEPGVNPPDADEDSAPTDPSTMAVEDFDFLAVQGIGPKGAKGLVDLANARGWSLVDLLDQDLTAAEGIGAKGAERIKEAIRAAEPWSPGKEQRDEHARARTETPLLASSDPAPAAPEPNPVPSDAPKVASVRPAAEPRKAEPASSTPDVVVEETPAPDGSRVYQINARVAILYVDCAPARGGGEVWHLEDLLAPLKRQVEEAEGWAYWNMDRYGAGKKRLLHLVMEQREELFEGKKSVIAISRHEGMDMVLPEIMGLFDLVVLG